MGSIKSMMLKTHSKGGGKPAQSSLSEPSPPTNTCSPNPSQCQRQRRKSEAGFGGVLLLINSPFQSRCPPRRGEKLMSVWGWP